MSQPPAQELRSQHDEAARHSLDVLGREILNPISNWALFWKPRYLAPSPALVHLPYLFWLIENHAPRRVVQLGVGDGVAYLGVCQAIDKLRLDAACWGISLPENGREASCAAIENSEKFYDDFSIVKAEKMATAHRHFRNGGIDLLIVNTPLDEESAALLNSEWKELLSERGLIVVLDSTTRMTESGATSWLDPLLAAHPGIELDQGEGLVTLVVGADQNSRIGRLADLELGMAGYREARQVFRRLGDSIVARTRVSDLEETLDADSKSLTEARNELARNRDELAKARSSEEDAVQQLAATQARIFDLQNERQELRSRLADAKKAEEEVDRLKAERGTLEDELSKAGEKLAEAEKARTDFEEQLSAKDDQVVAELSEATAELARLKSRYQDRLADIAELGHSISRKDDELEQLKAQHDDGVMQQYILSRLTDTRSHLQAALYQPHRLRAYKRAKKRIAEEIRLVEASGLFDAEWYCASYPDADDSGIEPIRHFVTQGIYELHNPGPDFDSFKYHKSYPDVTAEGIAALIHYVRNGKNENRRIFPVGDGR